MVKALYQRWWISPFLKKLDDQNLTTRISTAFNAQMTILNRTERI
jgi:hypothetical protein